MGVAGRARARAIGDDPRAVGVCGWRGAPAAVGLPEVSDLDTLLAQVDAVAICSPDAAHGGQVRRALEAGRHVVVEYPLAEDAASMASLFELARSRGRVLHVEQIALLTPAAGWWRGLRGQLATLEVGFTGRLRQGSVARANLARWHRIQDLLGPIEAIEVVSSSATRLQGRARCAQGEAGFDFEHGASLGRSTRLVARLRDGRVVREEGGAVTLDGASIGLERGPGLFLQDQLVASARVLEGGAPYVSEASLLAVAAAVQAAG